MAVCEAFVMTHGDIYSRTVIRDLFIPPITCVLYYCMLAKPDHFYIYIYIYSSSAISRNIGSKHICLNQPYCPQCYVQRRLPSNDVILNSFLKERMLCLPKCKCRVLPYAKNITSNISSPPLL